MSRWGLLFLCAGCVQQQPSFTSGVISSVALELLDPASVGAPDRPVDVQHARFNLRALDDHGNVWPDDVDVNVFVSFGGVKTGLTTSCGADVTETMPIATIHLAQGMADDQMIDLPQAFGPTTIWVDEPISHATGASPTIYLRNPLISDMQKPPDLTAANATFCSPFSGKFITVDRATGSGQLVVSSVFINAFAVTDTGASQWNSVYLFSFGKPPGYIVPGKVLNWFSGNVSKFVGFTELNFPLFQAADDTVPLAALPAPVVLSHDSLANRDNVGLLAYDASVVQYTGKICDPLLSADQWTKFNEFVVDGDTTCSSLTNYAVQLPAKTLGSFDPLMAKGQTATFVGMLRNNSGQNPVLDANGMTISCSGTSICVTGSCVDGICKKGAFNFWTINPRTPADVTVQ